MSDNATFASRTGRLSCAPGDVFNFVTDLRNFKQFIPEDTIENLKLEKESCTFNVPPLGNVDLYLSEKEPHTKVLFTGTALKSNNFSMFLNISDTPGGKAEVKVILNAEMNPILRMMAEKSITRFLELVIDKMETFRDWEGIKE